MRTVRTKEVDLGWCRPRVVALGTPLRQQHYARRHELKPGERARGELTRVTRLRPDAALLVGARHGGHQSRGMVKRYVRGDEVTAWRQRVEQDRHDLGGLSSSGTAGSVIVCAPRPIREQPCPAARYVLARDPMPPAGGTMQRTPSPDAPGSEELLLRDARHPCPVGSVDGHGVPAPAARHGARR